MFFQYSLIILLKFILDFRRDATQEFCQDGEVSMAWPVCHANSTGTSFVLGPNEHGSEQRTLWRTF